MHGIMLLFLYGFGLNEVQVYRKKRYIVWLLIEMLASLIAWLTGKWGEQMNYQKQFQTNSVSSRRVLSFFYLGCEMIRKKIHSPPGNLWKIASTLHRKLIL